MKMKKFFSVGMAVMLSIGALAGCQSGGNQSASTAEGESEKVYKIGVVQYADHPSLDNCRDGFIEGLKEAGYEEGKNLEITMKSAQGNDATNVQIAQSFVSDKADLVCGIATPSAMALYNACYEKKIPVIFNAVSDPVQANLAVSTTEAKPGISGVSDALPVERQLQLIREILPEAKTIGIAYTTSEANSVSTLALYKSLAGQYGFEIIEKGISNAAELPQAMDILVGQADCISNMTDNTVVNNLPVELEKANGKKIPVFGSEEEQVGNGCIASAGIDYIELGRQAGAMAARVLSGEDIGTMPCETITESKITINPAAAEALGITIPESVLNTAEVKESSR